MKTHIIAEALQLGFSVFILDVDIALFKDPMPYFDCVDCDIQVSRVAPTVGRGGGSNLGEARAGSSSSKRLKKVFVWRVF